jgi:hypothetical protein
MEILDNDGTDQVLQGGDSPKIGGVTKMTLNELAKRGKELELQKDIEKVK